MAPTVSCRGGLMELRQPSRKVMQLSQHLFVSQKTRNKTHTNHPPPIRNGYMTGHLQSGQQSCLWPSWAFASPPSSQLPVRTAVPPRAQVLGHGLCWDPGQPSMVPSPSLTLLWQPRVLKANSTPHNQTLSSKLDKVIQNWAHSKEFFTLGYSPGNCIYLDKAAVKLLLLVKRSFWQPCACWLPFLYLAFFQVFTSSLSSFSSLSNSNFFERK